MVGGVTLHYDLSGPPNAPLLVLLHSLGSDLRIWNAVAAQLGDYRILRYDLRGHGLSDAPPGPYRVDDLSRELLGLLEHLLLPEAILVGISVGGLVAQAFALRFPERVRALALCDTGMRIGTSAFWRERVAAVRAQGLANLAETVVSRWFAQGFAERQPAAYRGHLTMLARTSEVGYCATCAALAAADLSADAERLSLPTLILCGALDSSTPPHLSEALHRAIRGSSLVLIPGAGHLPCTEQPELVATKLATFFKEVSA